MTMGLRIRVVYTIDRGTMFDAVLFVVSGVQMRSSDSCNNESDSLGGGVIAVHISFGWETPVARHTDYDNNVVVIIWPQ